MSGSTSIRGTPPRVLACVALALLFTVLLFSQLVEGRRSAGRTLGIVLDEEDGAVNLLEVAPEGPAGIAGLLDGDRILEINGEPVRSLEDYDLAARSFEPTSRQHFTVSRSTGELEIAVSPGVPFEWTPWSLNAASAIAHLGLGLLVLVYAAGDLRARLLWVLCVAIALELALPIEAIGAPGLVIVAGFVFWVLNGLQFGVELHLASVIPHPRAWVRGWRSPLPLYYGLGLGFGLLLAASELPGAEQSALLGWLWTPFGDAAFKAWILAWPIGVVILLTSGVARSPEPTGRQQACLVLLAVLPWAALTVATTYWDHTGKPYPAWIEMAEPLVLLIYPLVVFLAIFRYHLFDLELVVKRSLVYATLSTILLLAFYSAFGIAGAALSMLLEGTVPTTYLVAGVTLILGMVFSPLKRLLEGQIESRFFPERAALRERLNRMVRDLPGKGQLSAMAETLVADVVEIFAVESACLLLSDRDSKVLIGRASKGNAGAADSLLVSKSDPFVDFLHRRGRASPANRWPQTRSLATRMKDVGGELAIPIIRSDDLTGILVLGAKKSGDDFAAEEVELLELLSHHVATVLENAHLFESATIDSLTGLLRREAVQAELETELLRARRHERPLTLAMIDIDRFKSVNDDFGHAGGDLVLRKVAGELSRCIRSTDVLGRFGGEEFLLLLPECDSTRARRLAERLRQVIESLEVEIEQGETIGVTISIGLAGIEDLPTGRDATMDALLDAADRSLYRAKRGGRNRVEMLAAC